MDLFKECISDFTDEEITEVINLLQKEQRDRVRRKDREAVKEFQQTMEKFFERNILCYIIYHDERIYLDAEDLHFEVE